MVHGTRELRGYRPLAVPDRRHIRRAWIPPGSVQRDTRGTATVLSSELDQRRFDAAPRRTDRLCPPTRQRTTYDRTDYGDSAADHADGERTSRVVSSSAALQPEKSGPGQHEADRHL